MSHNILEYLEHSTLQHPSKTAVADQENSYSFCQLKDMSKQLGSVLTSYQLHGQPIGVFANRKANTAVLFLGVLYSGNYYIPIDPSMPQAKLQAILEDSGIEILVGDAENRTLLEQLHFSGTFLTLADLSAEIAPIDIPGLELETDAPLYMVYTSGSTGKPKGVLKSHDAMISFIEAYTKTFEFCSEDVIGNQTPFFFDASAKDFYLMLKTGATLEILPTELFSFPVLLIRYLNDRKVTFISWVPTALSIVTQLNTFLEVLPFTLKKVFFVGEVFPLKQLKKWKSFLPNLQYVNLYGSSEIAGICCYYEVQGDLAGIESLPMGKPLCNCEVFLMDGNVQIIQPHETGEIYIASPALALEYYHDPEKTDACFSYMDMPDGTRKRVFKTGDLAQYDENGNLVFVSRKDFQIKHMGHRIELGEIETVADTLPEIQRCCCLYHQKRMKITLFCELSADCSWDGRAVQHALRSKLSDYMLPSKVVVMDKLPLNANGKIDRQTLKQSL